MSANSKWLGMALLWLASGTIAAEEPKPAAPVPGPAVGDAMPAFESTDDQDRPWKSADFVGKKVLVLYFYPGDFTGGCIKQVQAYRDGLAKIEEQGVELVGVSGDEVATHALFKTTYGLKHTLLADTKGDLAMLFGVPVGAGGRVQAMNSDRKPLLDADEKPIRLLRAVTLDRWTVVVDRDGKIASVRKIVNPVTDSAEVLKIVEALSK